MGFGSALNIVFIMIELRMPTDRLGSSMVIVVTSAVFYSSLASYVAYLPQPIPYLVGTSIVLTAMALTLILPEGG
jgi:hypothetical protein